jgi:hypothetical protein
MSGAVQHRAYIGDRRHALGAVVTRTHVAVLAVTLTLVILYPSALTLAAQPVCYTPEQAAVHVGETACVDGLVTSAFWAQQSNGRPTFLDFGTSFTVVIWQEDRGKFNPPPETLRGQRLRVQGRIETFRGKPQIIARNPSQLTAAVPAPAVAVTAIHSATVVVTISASATPSATAVPSPTVVLGTPIAPLAVIGTLTPVIVTRSALGSDVGESRRPPLPVGADEATTESSLDWPLVAGGLGLIGAGAAGAAWYGLRRRDQQGGR